MPKLNLHISEFGIWVEILILICFSPYINAENCWDFLAVYLNHDITTEQ
jgi:hypothetical protein